MMLTAAEKNVDALAVISLHGIRTRGEWQKTLSPEITRLGISYHPWDYGFFDTLSLIMPGARQKVVDDFRDYYAEVRRSTNGPISVIAHSFGTYIVAEALAQYPMIKLDRVIFCGSIVPTDYDWTNIIEARQQVGFVLNQFGKSDIWVRLVGWGVSNAGPSGYVGFEDRANGKVKQQGNPAYKHSQYFFGLNYTENWIPFLKGADLPDTAPLRSQRTNLKFRFSIVGTLLILAMAAFSWHRFGASSGNGKSEEKVDLSKRESTTSDVPVRPNSEQEPNTLTGTVVSSSPPAHPAVLHSSLHLTTNLTCDLAIDGVHKGRLTEGAKTKQVIDQGMHEVTCVSIERPRSVYKKTVTIAGDKALRLSFTTGSNKDAKTSGTTPQKANDQALELLEGSWTSKRTSLVSANNGCNTSTTATNTLRIGGLNQDGTIAGDYTEVLSTTAIKEKNTPSVGYLISYEQCNKQVNGDSEINTVIRSEQGTLQFDFRGNDPKAYIDIASCTIGENDCPPDEYGVLDFGDVEILGQAKKLAIGDRIYTKQP